MFLLSSNIKLSLKKGYFKGYKIITYNLFDVFQEHGQCLLMTLWNLHDHKSLGPEVQLCSIGNLVAECT